MRLALLIRGLVFKGKVLVQNMSHFKTVNEQARHNELQRLEVREKELFLQQQELQRYRNELQAAQDSDEENTWKQEEQIESDDEAEQAADRAEQAAEEERKRAYLMELAKSKHKKKTSGKFTMYR